MDTAQPVDSVLAALGINLGVMLVFGFTHSLFARKSVKKWMALPASVERSFFCLQGSFFLHMLQKFWVEVDSSTIWNVSDSPALCMATLTIFWFGAAFLLTSTFALDHFHLFGLSQAFEMDLNKKFRLTPKKLVSGLATRWHYGLVAHPIMTGALINCWATPIMTSSRLLFAVVMTTYMIAAVTRLEEPSLRQELGASYSEYLMKTPRFFPSALAWRKSAENKSKTN